MHYKHTHTHTHTHTHRGVQIRKRLDYHSTAPCIFHNYASLHTVELPITVQSREYMNSQLLGSFNHSFIWDGDLIVTVLHHAFFMTAFLFLVHASLHNVESLFIVQSREYANSWLSRSDERDLIVTVLPRAFFMTAFLFLVHASLHNAEPLLTVQSRENPPLWQPLQHAVSCMHK